MRQLSATITEPSIPLWELARYKLRSLKDVIPAQVHLYTESLASLAANYGLVVLHVKLGTAPPANALDAIRERIAAVKVFAEECDLRQSAHRCDHVISVLQKYPNRADFIKTALQGLLESFSIDTCDTKFLYQPSLQISPYQGPVS